MNGNRIDLAEIYGLNRSPDTQVHSKTMNIQPPALEQIAGTYSNMQTVPAPNDMEDGNEDTSLNDMDEIMVNPEMNDSFRTEKCQEGRCRFAPIPHEHTDNTDVGGCLSCKRNDFAPITEYNQPYPITAQNIQYLNTFIRSQVGRRVHVEFLIGTNNIVEKDGYLMAVGANFILLNPIDTKDIIACDFYNIKFMKFYY